MNKPPLPEPEPEDPNLDEFNEHPDPRPDDPHWSQMGATIGEHSEDLEELEMAVRNDKMKDHWLMKEDDWVVGLVDPETDQMIHYLVRGEGLSYKEATLFTQSDAVGLAEHLNKTYNDPNLFTARRKPNV